MRVLLATAGLLVLVGSAAAQPPASHTLRRSAAGPIDALAQDGSLVAWLAPGGRRCNAVHVLEGSKTAYAPAPAASSMTCRWDLSEERPQLAVAAGASAVLWTLHEGGSAPFDYVLTAQIGGPERRLDRLAHGTDGTGVWLGGVAGEGTTLAYSYVNVEYVNQLSCLAGGSCRRRIAGGGIRIVANGTTEQLPGAGPALELAASDGRLAYVPASVVQPSGRPGAAHATEVNVVDATSGAPVSAAKPPGIPLAIALSEHVLVVLTRSDRRDSVSWYDPDDGTSLGSVRVATHAAPELAANDRIAVFRAGHTLQGVVFSTGRVRKLATVAGTPGELALWQGQLLWTENRGDRGAIRALDLD